jgi:hypothetical protein
VKDGSGALYVLPGQNHKSEKNNLTRSGEEERRTSGRDTPKHTKHLDFQLHNPLKFKRRFACKKLGWLTKIH